MTSTRNTAQHRTNRPHRCALGLRALIMVIVAAITVGCASTMPRTDMVHTVAPGESLKDISLQYTGTPDNDKAIAARSGILKPSRVRAGDKVTIPANLLPPDTRSGGLSPAATADAHRTIAEAIAAGAALGAVGGGVGCKKNRASCAGIGAGVGALTGLFAGVVMVMAKQAFVSDEERLNQEIAFGEKYNQELQTHNTQLGGEITQLTAESNRLRQQVKRGQGQAGQLAAQQQKVSALLAANQKLLTDSRKELARQGMNYAGFAQGKTATNPNTAKLKAEVSELKTKTENLDGEIRKLAAVNDRLSA